MIRKRKSRANGHIMQNSMCYNNRNTINNMKMKLGDNSDNVKVLQEMLMDIVELYPSIPQITIDGIYGVKTQAAVKRFQELMGIYETGAVDNLTWKKLLLIHSKKKAMNDNDRFDENDEGLDLSNNVVKLGSKGRYVIELQEYLNKVSNLYPAIEKVSIDGVFGQKTQDAVIRFQTLFDLEADGVVGNVTWNALYNASLGKLSPGGNINL